MLYLVSTPIGNLADITFRAVETLKHVDYILCEDTRHSLHLLQTYEIHKPLKSYHKFNEASREESTIQDLLNGMHIALISDAGTPGISDPGSRLVARCIAAGIVVSAIPGPCAAIQAVVCSGLSTDRFQFVGFLPKKAGELKKAAMDILAYKGTTVCYLSPNRLLEVLSLFAACAPQRKLAIARELTKKFEEYQRGTATELLEYWKERQPRGEIVFLVDGQSAEMEQEWTNWSPEEHVQWVEETYKLSKQEAIKMVASIRGMPKRQLYSLMHQSDAVSQSSGDS